MMKFLFDLFPVILFFGVFKWGEGDHAAAHDVLARYMGGLIPGGGDPATAPVMLATLACMLGAALQIGYLLARGKKVDGMLWVSAGTIAVLGGLTIYFKNEDFIKWKPTILYWVFALILFVGQVLFKNNLMRKVLEVQFKLPEPIWARVGYVWMTFFFAIGVLNLFVAFVLFKSNTAAWVNFKVFGITAIFFCFMVIQALFLSKHILEEDA